MMSNLSRTVTDAIADIARRRSAAGTARAECSDRGWQRVAAAKAVRDLRCKAFSSYIDHSSDSEGDGTTCTTLSLVFVVMMAMRGMPAAKVLELERFEWSEKCSRASTKRRVPAPRRHLFAADANTEEHFAVTNTKKLAALKRKWLQVMSSRWSDLD